MRKLRHRRIKNLVPVHSLVRDRIRNLKPVGFYF